MDVIDIISYISIHFFNDIVIRDGINMIDSVDYLLSTQRNELIFSSNPVDYCKDNILRPDSVQRIKSWFWRRAKFLWKLVEAKRITR